jgi:hypothetical protein
MPDTEKNQLTAAPIAPVSATTDREPPFADEAGASSDDAAAYERLLDMYDVSFKNFAEGEVVRGVVLKVSESEVIVDVGYKSEGVIQIEEFKDEAGKINIKPGDSVEVLLAPRTRTATSSCPRKRPRR